MLGGGSGESGLCRLKYRDLCIYLFLLMLQIAMVRFRHTCTAVQPSPLHHHQNWEICAARSESTLHDLDEPSNAESLSSGEVPANMLME